MPYPEKIQKRLNDAKIQVGDTIQVYAADKVYKGILMPHHEFSGSDIVTVKVETGYNIGIEVKDKTEFKLLEKSSEQDKKREDASPSGDKPTVSILGTGGTIASYVDYRTGAVHPAMDASDLAYSVPELAEICNIKAKLLFNIFSEDMKVEHWQKLASEVEKELNSGAKGVIIAHGTDTLGYTSAALSFMLRDLTGPVILVGAQRSSDRPSSDANMNLVSSAHLAVNSDLGEVVVAMHGEMSDSYVLIHRGTRVRKMHTSRRDAFHTVNEEPLGMVRSNEIVFSQPYKKRSTGKTKADTRMEGRVCMMYSYPDIKPEDFDYLAGKNKGFVIAGTGLGHVPKTLIAIIKGAIESGVHVVMTSQCLNGTVNMKVYSSGRDLLKSGVISGEDMLPETAYVKLMWVLGRTQEPDEVKKLMETNLVGEMNERRGL
jgi:glutamyl-tRNA(Gln) amidotransferase subunit D